MVTTATMTTLAGEAQEDPVLNELTATLREWHQIWLSLYLDNQADLFERIGELLLELTDAREELFISLKSSLQQQQQPQLATAGSSQEAISRAQRINELKASIINKLDLGNRLLGLDLILRDAEFRPVDPVKLSPVKLYQLHADAAVNETNTLVSGQNQNGYQESIASTNGSSSYSISQVGSSEANHAPSNHHNQHSYHLQMALQKHQLSTLPPDETIEIYFSIVELDPTPSSSSHFVPVTEKFLVQLKNDQIIDGLPSTIFTNIGSLKFRELGLLVQVYRVGRMLLTDGNKTTFGRQQSSSNMPTNIYSDLSTTSHGSKVTNEFPRSRHSTIGGMFNYQPSYRRPFGATYFLLTNQFKNTGPFKDFRCNVKVVAVQNESEFLSLNDFYPKKSQMKMNQNQPNIQVELNMRFLIGALESIPRLTSFGCNEYCLTEKRGFPDVVMPGDFKNDLYFTIEGAEFEKGGKSIAKNIEASISLINRSGFVIEHCIVPASNCDKVSCYNSSIFYHSNSPRWNEAIKINVPLIEFDEAHIRIEFRHCSTKDRDKKFLGFSYLPLSDADGTVIPDKSHELYLYKCDPQLWEPMNEPQNLCKYTTLPYGPGAKTNPIGKQQCFTHSSREMVTVSTFLLSTKLTQNSTLLNLFKWREYIDRNKKDFEGTLKEVLVLRGEEIVKFLQDILDTLFDTFTLYLTREDDGSALIFRVLVHIFLLLDEPKYHHFKPVLNTYASAHFSATLVYKCLLACVKKCLEYAAVPEWHTSIQRVFKAQKYVFQFIVQSRILYSKATGEQNDEHFLNDLRHLFKLYENLLANDDKMLIPLQETLLESFPAALEQLMRVMSSQELAQVVTSLAGSIGFHLPPPLSKSKLIFMRGTANSSLLTNQELRIQISEIFCRHLVIYITNSDRLELCHEVLESLIVKVHDNHWPSILRLYQLSVKSQPQDGGNLVMSIGEINIYSKTSMIQANQLDLALLSVARELEPFVKLMDPLLKLLDKLVRDLNNDRPIIQRYCNGLLTILKLMGRISFDQFIARRQIDYLALCDLFKSLRSVYYRDWSIMQLTSHAILEHPIYEISRIEFNQQPSSYIHLIVDFITHPTLQLEAFSERKKTYVLKVFGDLRLKFSLQLMNFWKNLGTNRISELIPTSIQAFLDAALLPNHEIQQQLMPVFYNMIDADDRTKSNLRQIERCLIDNLDLFMNLDRGNAAFIDNFDSILKSLVEEKEPSWAQRGLKLINSFTKLMHLLVNYRQSLESYDSKSKQMVCLVDLLGFYKDQDRMDIYLKYLFKLCDIHLESGYHTEAAFTLKLYADELRWCNRNLSALEGFRPDEQEWKRKEILYQRIIHYFDLGKCWEESISLCKELASFYENFLVDYERVSGTLRKLAQLLDNILTEHRPEREYFRVEFLGSDHSEFVRGKEFIYRGGEYERLATFLQRITSEFPDAKMINAKERKSILSNDSKSCQGKYLVISNVKAMPFIQDTFKSGQRIINDKILHYYLNNRLDTFSYDLPIVKGEPVSNEKNLSASASCELNLRNLWVGRSMLKIKKQLPDILPWSEVVSQEYIEISPITNAIETVSSMNVELSKLILSYTKEPSKQLSPLTMRLQGVLEAAVNGGPTLIVNAFFKKHPDEPADSQPPQDHESLMKLRSLIKQQLTLLETGLGLHSKLAPVEMMPLQARLVERLETLRKSFIEETSQTENSYETLHNHLVSGRNEKAIANDVSTARTGGESSSSSCLDEVDGRPANRNFHDSNGNICLGESGEEQIYSQPSEVGQQQVPGHRAESSNGTRSELSSPSRHYVSGSSSLSTLAILGNMPLNRTRISLTPSKELNATLYRGSAHLESKEFCNNKAARRLTYDSGRVSADMAAHSTLSTTRRFVKANSKASTGDGQMAPPLPPRLFMPDKSHALMAISKLPHYHHQHLSKHADGRAQLMSRKRPSSPNQYVAPTDQRNKP